MPSDSHLVGVSSAALLALALHSRLAMVDEGARASAERLLTKISATMFSVAFVLVVSPFFVCEGLRSDRFRVLEGGLICALALRASHWWRSWGRRALKYFP